MKTIKVFFLILTLLKLSSCEEGGGPNSVSVETKGIFEPVSIKINGIGLEGNFYDLDEFVKSSSPMLIEIEIRNNSKFRIFELGLIFNNKDITNYSFAVGSDGKFKYPGAGGTCSSELASGKSCKLVLQFSSIISGQIKQSVTLNYKNLIEESKKDIEFTVLSGDPASLIFVPDITNYYFGNLTGLAQTPLVERNIRQSFFKTLTIKNVGELRARNITHMMSQGCVSKETNNCPTGQDKAFNYTNMNCPEVMLAGESCQVSFSYQNLNQGNSIELEHISYRSTGTLDYERDPLKNKNSLNAYWSSVSTNIKAYFESSVPSIVFENALIVGNRDRRVLRIKNSGYREGFLRMLNLYKLGESDPSFYCVKESEAKLACYNSSDNTVASLQELPFLFYDKESCMNQAMDHEFPNDSACLFEVVFQPSVAQANGETLRYNVHFEYDSRWLGQQDIVRHSEADFSIEASYTGAANIQVVGFQIYGSSESANKIDANGVAGYDLGRIALMLESFYVRRTIAIIFRNVGESTATNVSIRDGSNNILPFTTNTSFGGEDPKYYTEVSAPESSCSKVSPGHFCSISMSFAPIDRDTETKIHDSMFDYWDSFKSPNNYKLFSLSYNDGSIYTDTNYESTVPDVGQKTTQAKIYGTPVTVGLLSSASNLYTDGNKTLGEESYTITRIRNIGTGRIPYLRLYNERSQNCDGAPLCAFTSGGPASKRSYFTQLNPSELSTYGESTDCLDIINWKGNTAYEVRGSLDKGESCLLKMRYFADAEDYENPVSVDIAREAQLEHLRPFSKEVNNMYLYFLTANRDFVTEMAGFSLIYFNGDVDNPSKDGTPYDLGLHNDHNLGDPVTYCLGDRGDFCDAESNLERIQFRSPPILVANSPSPNTGAVLYRPSFMRPTLTDSEGNLLSTKFPGDTVGDIYFYNGLFTTNSGGLKDELDEGEYSFAHLSAPITVSNDYYSGLCPSCEFVLFLGSYPVGINQAFSFNIGNAFNNTETQITSVATSGVHNTFFSHNGADLIGLNIGNDISQTLSGQYQPGSAGTHHMILTLNYDNKLSSLPDWDLKVLVVARAVGDAPDLELSYTRFNVDTDPGVAPVESEDLGSVQVINDLYNNQGIGTSTASNTLIMQMVKLETIDFDSGYVKKRLKLRNKSSTKTLNELEYIFRDGPSDTDAFGGQLSGLSIDDTQTPNHCGHKTDLTPGEVCYIDFTYQPTQSDVPISKLLSFYYVVDSVGGNKQINIKNMLVSLTPLDPSRLGMVGYTQSLVTTSSAGDVDPTAYRFDFGSVVINQTTKKLQYGPVQILNNSSFIRASFLAAYEEHKGASGYPSAGEWESINSDEYVVIYDQGKTKVKANRECIYGDDDPSLEPYEKGFLGGSSTEECNLIIELSLTPNDVGNHLDKADWNDMQDFYFKLKYYSFERVSKNQLSFFFTGSIYPDTYTSSNSVYNVSGLDSKQISFTFDQAAPSTSSVGSIAGYRVYYATNPFSLNDVIFSGGNYIGGDFYNTSDPIDILYDPSINNMIQRGEVYYFKIVAIRDYPGYNAGNFQGLGPGYYLSEADSSSGYPILRVLVPRSGHVYLHDLQAMVDKNVLQENGTMKIPTSYSIALADCTGKNGSFIDKGVSKPRPYQLMTKSIWDEVADDLDSNDYSNHLRVPHWVAPQSFDINAIFSGNPSFDPNATSACFSSLKSCYYKCTDDCPSERMIVGGFYGDSSAEDYISYAGDSFVAHTRCYIDVSP